MEETPSIDPNVWGPALWDVLFTVAIRCPLKECVVDVQHLFVLLERIMPCSHCRRSYTLYRKELKPTTVIRNSNPDSASAWLWTIHDMVNQKLGKICISFEKLQKKHRSFTTLVHDLPTADLLVMIALAMKPSVRADAVQFFQVLCRLLRHCGPHMQLPTFCTAIDMQPDTLVQNVCELHRRVGVHYGYAARTDEDIIAQISQSFA